MELQGRKYLGLGYKLFSKLEPREACDILSGLDRLESVLPLADLVRACIILEAFQMILRLDFQADTHVSGQGVLQCHRETVGGKEQMGKLLIRSSRNTEMLIGFDPSFLLGYTLESFDIPWLQVNRSGRTMSFDTFSRPLNATNKVLHLGISRSNLGDSMVHCWPQWLGQINHSAFRRTMDACSR